MTPGPGDPWWKQYLIPTLLSFAVAFSGWSVTQHFVIRGHDQQQEMRLASVEYRIGLLERNDMDTARVHEQLATLDATTRLMLDELKRVRDRLERLESRR